MTDRTAPEPGKTGATPDVRGGEPVKPVAPARPGGEPRPGREPAPPGAGGGVKPPAAGLKEPARIKPRDGEGLKPLARDPAVRPTEPKRERDLPAPARSPDVRDREPAGRADFRRDSHHGGHGHTNVAIGIGVGSMSSQGLFAASVYSSSHGGSSFSFFLSSGPTYVAPYAAVPYYYAWQPAPYYWSACYAPCWGPVYSPVWYPGPWYAAPAAYPCWGGSSFGFSYFSSDWRLSVGFGQAYAPAWYHDCWHPFYRTYAYFPYHYYSTVAYYPAYTVVYTSAPTVVEYVDTADPYVEYVDDVPVATPAAAPPAGAGPARASAPAVPEEFQNPLVDGFPEALSPAEVLAKGESWLRSGEYLLAAEAFRRSWVARPDDYYAPLQLGFALFASGGRYGLASMAVSDGLDRNPEWPRRKMDLREALHPTAFEAALRDLQRHLLKNPRDGEARFLYGYVLFFSGAEFAAHNEFTDLRDGDWKSPHLPTFIDECQKRLLGTGEPKPAGR